MKKLTGINIQFPISRLILEGKKIVETRTYPIPEQYLGQEMALVETPGKSGNFIARIVGTIKFDRCFKYKSSSEFYRDQARHHVTPESPWKWTDEKPKWGWCISQVQVFKKPRPAPQKKGIVYTKDIEIPS